MPVCVADLPFQKVVDGRRVRPTTRDGTRVLESLLVVPLLWVRLQVKLVDNILCTDAL
jgi:hypothetical protein